MEIQLGDKVRCKVTGFVGVAISKTEFLNGCIQYDVVPKVTKDNKILDGVSIDEQSLEVVSKKKKPKKFWKKESTGGRMNKAHSVNGY